MKKLFKPLAIIALALAMMPSCSDTDNEAPYVDPNNGGSTDDTTASVTHGSTTEPIDYKTFTALTDSEADSCYMKGYIVGYIPSLSSSDAVFQNSDTCSIQTNILIAESASESDISNCIAVQLPTGKIRSAVNLKDNPKNLGQEIVLGGFKVTYFKMTGLKNVFYAKINGEEITNNASVGYDGENLTQTEVTLPYTEDFDGTKTGKFSFYNAKIKGVSYIWTYNNYGMVGSGYANGSANEVEGWSISPKINLGDAEKPVVTISHKAGYFSGAPEDEVSFKISADFDGEDPTQADWEDLDVENWPTDCTAGYKDATATVDLSDYAGKKITIAVIYTSGSKEKAGTYEILDFKVYDDAQHTIVENQFDGRDTTTTSVSSLNEAFTSTIGVFSIFDFKKYSDLNEHIWTPTKYGATAVASKASESWLISAKVTLAEDKEYLLTFTNYYKGTDKPAENFVAYVSENYTGGNPSEATWTDLEMKFGESAKSNTDTIDFTSYAGKSFYIAFKYVCTDDVLPTCEVQNLKLDEKVVGPQSGFDGTDNTSKSVTELNETLLGSQGSYTIYDVSRPANINHIWTSTASYGMKASAYANKTEYESESWLISPEFDLTNNSSPQYLFSSYYSNNSYTPDESYTFMVSTDYTAGSDPTKATWTKINVTWPSAYTTWTDATVDLSAYKGKKIYIAFKYTSDTKSASTLEIKNTVLKDASATSSDDDDDDDDDDDEETSTKGTQADPYSCTEVRALDVENSVTYADQYIVGYIIGCADATLSAAQIGVDEYTVKSNILVADSPSETSTDKVIVVKLSTSQQTNWALTTNKDKVGTKVIIKGTIKKYFGVAGVNPASTITATTSK